ncbi:MAG: hypothetical protein DHS20C17_02270 [Cyclobacteriaceae bacterium]|nr:MAG: hypothetical protein DHS20C17_02270 [Cyclobacteriaceae bacterium]
MKGFITHIVDRLPPDDLNTLHTRAFVFPSRRACYHFREALLNRFPQETFWLPAILSVEDFIVRCTGKSISNELDLLFALYQHYKATYPPNPEGKVDKEELPTFDKFYSWGQVLLRDFDEVDRYLVNAKDLYRNLEQLRDIENRYQDSEEVLFALKRFNDMMGNEPTLLSSSFSNQWSRVSKTYHSFRGALGDSDLQYGGMLYRQLAEQLQDGTIDLPFERVVFAGFNALSRSEEVIMETLLKKGIAEVYWDADKLFLENEVEEAGRFMRRNRKKWPPTDQVHWVISDMAKHHKKIQFIGGVQSVGQAQVVGQLLQQMTKDQLDNCGLVLADEGLLFPLLYALPENINSLNVTMGYPAKHSHWFRLTVAFLDYQLNKRGRGESTYADTQYTRELLMNPLIKRSVPGSGKLLLGLRKKSKWVGISELITEDSGEILKLALTSWERVNELIAAVVKLLLAIYQKLRVEEKLELLETEFAYHALKHLLKLGEGVEKYHQELEPITLSRLIIQALEQARIPFSGEPTEGLQMMGFLETRALDFERVIMVSANEGQLPKGNQHNSYIPFAIRKAFKLPTFEEQDAIYAYHFKRVLQRASDISIVYNTEVAIDGSGEKSRYLWQLKETFPKEMISECIYQMPFSKSEVNSQLEIPKSAEILEQMQRFLVIDETAKSLSPTAIRHYLDCSLRFYFRYIVKLREREKETTDLDPRDFGNIVHQAVEKIYQPLVGQTVTRDHIQDLLASSAINDAVDESISEHLMKSSPSLLEGKDILHQQVIQKLIYKAIAKDQWAAPFQLLGAEITLQSDLRINGGSNVRLEGTLDRVHLARGIVHIIDYKTGKVDLVYLPSKIAAEDWDNYVLKHFEEPKYKSGFQGLFYGYLWNKVRENAPIKLGVYPMKKVNEGIKWLNKQQVVPSAGFQEFERQLQNALNELFDETKPFVQTKESARCRFCDYKEICQR